MRLRLALDEKMMDIRVRDRLLAEGKITQKQVQEFLASVPDDEGKYEHVVKAGPSSSSEASN